MAKHTEGPWNEHRAYPLDSQVGQVSGGKHSGFSFDYWTGRIAKGEKLIGEAHYQSATDGGWPHVADLEEARANARLMIAAPELLDALNGVLGLLTLIKRRDDLPHWLVGIIDDSHRTITALELVERIESGVVREAQLEASDATV